MTALKTRKLSLILFVIFGTLLATSQAKADDPYQPTFTDLGDNVWAATRSDNPRHPVMGGTTFVISEAGVVVYDGGGGVLWAERVIEKIRSLTDKPVTHLVISHWHGDHSFGAYRFVEEFENVEVITHPFTKFVFDSQRIRYIDNYPNQIPPFMEKVEKILETGMDEGEPISAGMRIWYEKLVKDADSIHSDNQRVKILQPTLMFSDKISIVSGDRKIELRYMGDGNTAGDIIMWLPKEQIVAAGDIVVHPLGYAFNMPPKKWGDTLKAINALAYKTLVPGHGDIQTSFDYVNKLIKVADHVVTTRDKLLAEGKSDEEVQAALNVMQFAAEFVGDDPYLLEFYKGYFVKPLEAAAIKETKGIPMVEIK